MHRSVIAGGDLSDAKSEDANVVRNLCREIFENAAHNNRIFIPLRSVARGSKRMVSVLTWCQWDEEQAEQFPSVAVQYVTLGASTCLCKCTLCLLSATARGFV